MARSVRLALGGDLVPDAVNVSGGAIAEEVRPGIALVEKLGRIFTAVAGQVPVQLDIDVRGEITAFDVSVWQLSALKGLFQDVVEEQVSYVNAPVIAEQRGVETRLLTDAASGDFRNVTTLRGTLGDGTEVSVAGTLTGPRMIEKVVGINGFDLEVPLTDHLAVFTYADRPGVVGQVGQILGDEGINIGGMQVARSERHGSALVLLNVDVALPAGRGGADRRGRRRRELRRHQPLTAPRPTPPPPPSAHVAPGPRPRPAISQTCLSSFIAPADSGATTQTCLSSCEPLPRAAQRAHGGSNGGSASRAHLPDGHGPDSGTRVQLLGRPRNLDT